MKIGIDLGGTNIRIGRIENGKIVEKATAASPSKMNLDESISYLKSIISPFITPQIEGIGIGVPSVLDIEKGIVYNVANMTSWKEVHLKEILETEFRKDIYINNDSNCFTLGEKYFGEGKEFSNMVGVTLGTGVGAGIIINNQLYGGHNTGAGEIGCLPYLDATYEDYCSSGFFSKYHNTTGKETSLKAQKNEPEALNTWNEFGLHIGKLMQAIMFAYDPNAIILGGGIANSFALFSNSMYISMSDFPYPMMLKKLQIKVSKNPDIAILGAAALVPNRY